MISKTLIELSKISPKGYAKRILKRNESLMKRLMLLKPYLGKTFGDVPDKVIRNVLKTTSYGCPHCSKVCDSCLYSKAIHNVARKNKEERACCYVKFNNIILDNFSYNKCNISIGYWSSKESILLDNSDNIEYIYPSTLIRTKDWKKCRLFLQGHIDWAKMDCWGSRASV